MTFKSLSSEKIDVAYISIADQPLNYTGSINWVDDDVTLFHELEQDNFVYNTFVTALMELYNSVYENLDQQIEVEELLTYKKQALEVDGKN